MSKKFITIALFLISASFLVGACSTGDGVGLPGSEVLFDLTIIEIKGSTDGIDPPEVDPTSLSKGYRFKPPGDYDAENPAKWEVSTYLFSPSSLTAVQGDAVTLRMFVVNGDIHTTWLEAPDGTRVEEWVMNRGREYNITFSADQVGYYTIHCSNHEPTMEAKILVLPNNG